MRLLTAGPGSRTDTRVGGWWGKRELRPKGLARQRPLGTELGWAKGGLKTTVTLCVETHWRQRYPSRWSTHRQQLRVSGLDARRQWAGGCGVAPQGAEFLQHRGASRVCVLHEQAKWVALRALATAGWRSKVCGTGSTKKTGCHVGRWWCRWS